MKKGQSLFEVVIALGVVTLITVGIVILTINSIRNSTFSKNKTLASKYAQEAIEWVRGEREKNSSEFLDNVVYGGGVYCLDDLSWTNVGVCVDEYIAGTNLTREVLFTTSLLSGKNITEAQVVVSWDDSQGYHEARSTTSFADSREQ